MGVCHQLSWTALCSCPAVAGSVPCFLPSVCAPGMATGVRSAASFSQSPYPLHQWKMSGFLTTGSFSLAITQQPGHSSSLMAFPPFWKDVGDRGVVVGIGFYCLTTTGFIWRLSWKLSCLQFPWLRNTILTRGEAMGKAWGEWGKRLSRASNPALALEGHPYPYRPCLHV